MSRIPIRLRLTLAFAAAMALVLVAVGVLLYIRLGSSLQEQIDESLQERGFVLGEYVRATGSRDLDPTILDTTDEGIVQVLESERPRYSSPPLGASVLTESERRRAWNEDFFLTREVPDLNGSVRLFAVSTDTSREPTVLVVGTSLEDRREALDGLLAQLLVIGPLALLATCVAGYFLAGAALRPVEVMRRRAADVSSERTGQRLPLPAAADEIRRLGETLNDMLDRLEAGLARERRFVADASHELRTPLTALRTELELALRRPRSQAELEQSVRSAADEVERLVRLAEDLLVLARADEGWLPLDTSSHLVQELVDAVAGRYDARAAAQSRAIEAAAPHDRAVTGDRLRLEQALGNVVDNALRYGAGTVRIEAEPDDGFVEISVTDEGPGFPPEFLPHAFERFSRADVARGEGGAGLGLAIVDAIARAHGGSAAAANHSGGGAAVIIRLPASRVEERDAALI